MLTPLVRHHLMRSSEYDLPFGIVLSRLNVEVDEEKRIRYLPLYLSTCLNRMGVPEDGEPFTLAVARV